MTYESDLDIDNIIEKFYKMIVTFITGVIIQCRFRWIESIFYNSFSAVIQYLFNPIFLFYYYFDMIRPTIPTCHLPYFPYFINRIFLTEEPCLVKPKDLCNGNCIKKNCQKCINKRVIIYVNGSYTNREIHNNNLDIISCMFNIPCFGFYNPTSSFFVDTILDFIQRFTCFNGYKAQALLNEMICFTNENISVDEVVILTHGSGGLIAEQFLRLLRERKYCPKFINKFKFILVGSPVCNMKWTRNEKGRLISYTGAYLHEKQDLFGNKKCHKAYLRSKFYNNMCCDEDHSKSVPFPYIEHIFNTNDLIATAGIANNSKIAQSDMLCLDGVKIEICNKYGHFNYHLVDDENYKLYCQSYLARDYNPRCKYDKCIITKS